MSEAVDTEAVQERRERKPWSEPTLVVVDVATGTEGGPGGPDDEGFGS